MSWLVPHEPAKYRQHRARLVDRLFGVEYTSFENRQIQNFDQIKKNSNLVEISGFVSWIDKKQFLLLPTKTTAYPYIICEIETGIAFPNDNQYVVLKGKWKYNIDLKKSLIANKILIVDDIVPVQPDFGIISPDIDRIDFEQNLFDGWINIDPLTQNFIAQSLISSPTTPLRAGGLTTSLFNHPRQQRLVNLLHSDIKRSIARELYDNAGMSFDVYELGIKHKFSPFNWSNRVSDLENLSSTVSTLLDRVPNGTKEYSISLLSQEPAPQDLQSRGLVKSDYPILMEENAERKHNRYYASPEVTKYLITVQMNSPEMSIKVYDESIRLASLELQALAETKEYLTRATGHNQFLDLGVNGKPLSILNLAISRGRSNALKSITIENSHETTADYISNLDHIFDVWYELGVGKMNRLTTLSYNEQKIWAFLDNYEPHTAHEISHKLKIDYDECIKIINSLSYKGAVFVDIDGKYHPIPLQ